MEGMKQDLWELLSQADRVKKAVEDAITELDKSPAWDPSILDKLGALRDVAYDRWKTM